MMATERIDSECVHRVQALAASMQHNPARISFLPVFSGKGLMVDGIIPLKDNGGRDWESIESNTLLEYSKWRLASLGITGRNRLQKADSGLYQALRKRNLLDEVRLPNLRGEEREWRGMEEDELIAHAKAFIAERGITGRKGLQKADSGLYQALWRRKLLDTVGLGLRKEMRSWAAMGNKELIAFAKEFVASEIIGGRKGLEKADSGLYDVLWRRKLLDDVFSDAESSSHKKAVAGVLDALDSFGDEK